MSAEPNDLARRTVIQIAASLAAAGSLGAGSAKAEAKPPEPTGKLGDFDFLAGHWTIANRMLKDGQWEEFPGEATVYGLLKGLVSVEELRIPARDFSGLGLRILDVEKKLWADYWMNSKNGLLAGVPTLGSFVDGVGTWDADEKDGDQPIIARGVWDRITPNSCRWYQAISRDDGRTWQEQWSMVWTRIEPTAR